MTRQWNQWTSLAIAGLCAATLTIGGCGDKTSSSSASASGGGSANGGKRLKIAMLPKVKGVSYFTSCSDGAEEAAKELGDVDLKYDGPTDGDAGKSADLVGQWSLRGFDVIAVSASDPDVLGSAMKDVKAKGLTKLITWDADVAAEARSFFVNQATPQQIGEALVDTLAAEIGDAGGEVAIISSTQTSANQNAWMAQMTERLKKYPNLHVVATEYPGEDQNKCLTTTRALMGAHPNLKGIWAISSQAFPGAADAIKQAGKSGQIRLTGLATPNSMKQHVADGTVDHVILWNTKDLGYLTVYTAEAVATGKLAPGATSFKAGRLGEVKVEGDQVLLGKMLIFSKENIGQYDF